MKTVRTTFFANQKSHTCYCDVVELECRCEAEKGSRNTEEHKSYRRILAGIINYAYRDGYKDGLAEGLSKVAEDENGQAN